MAAIVNAVGFTLAAGFSVMSAMSDSLLFWSASAPPGCGRMGWDDAPPFPDAMI